MFGLMELLKFERMAKRSGALLKVFMLFMLFMVLLLFCSLPTQAQTAVTDSGGFATVGVGVGHSGPYGVLKNTDTSFTKAFSFPAQYDTSVTYYAQLESTSDSNKVKIVLQGYALGTWSDIKVLNDSLKVETLYRSLESLSGIYYQYRFKLIGLTGNGYKTNWWLDAVFRRYPY